MAKYKIKLSEVEARQFLGDGDSCAEIVAFIGDPNNISWNKDAFSGGHIKIVYDEVGAFSKYDYIFKDITGEYHTMSQRGFEQLYENIDA